MVRTESSRAETGGELTSFLRRPLAAKWETGCKVVGGESREPQGGCDCSRTGWDGGDWTRVGTVESG